jgi:protein-S-isoprenylcysteine O-methyltransferase Ste14
LITGAAGIVLGLVWPLSLGWDGTWPLSIGIVLVVSGVGLMIWATAAAGTVRVADPDQLVTTGPYTIVRHPMYLGWTLVYLGLMIISSSAWLLILFPVLAVWIHVETGREERRMIERFGSRYIEYRNGVRRYL